MCLQNAQLEKELELLRREYEDKEREWEAENTELKGEVTPLSMALKIYYFSFHFLYYFMLI